MKHRGTNLLYVTVDEIFDIIQVGANLPQCANPSRIRPNFPETPACEASRNPRPHWRCGSNLPPSPFPSRFHTRPPPPPPALAFPQHSPSDIFSIVALQSLPSVHPLILFQLSPSDIFINCRPLILLSPTDILSTGLPTCAPLL